MTPLLLHGPAINASRRKLQDIRKKFAADNIVVFEEGADLQIILSSLFTPSLFSDQQLIVLENPPQDLLNCNLSTVACILVLWFDHEVDTKKWPGVEALFFPEAREVSVFPLLDLLAAKNQQAFLEIEKLKQAGFDIHYCLTMAFYLLRNLVVTPKNAPEFVKKKLVRQRLKFNLEDITRLYKDLLEIDFKLKSGLLEKPQAEFLLFKSFRH